MSLKIDERIDILSELGNRLKAGDDYLEASMAKAKFENSWFTKEHIEIRIDQLVEHYLDRSALQAWVDRYDYERNEVDQTVGIIMAGNIPLVGFHDFLSAWLFGHHSKIKLSSKDEVLLPAILRLLKSIDERAIQSIELVEHLNNINALLATGSDNTQKYFEYYFKSVPKLLRHSRNGVAILDNQITPEELNGLCDDIFMFFGLGCRNVSKIYLPHGFSLDQLFEASMRYKHFMNHDKYKNNYDYNAATFMLNKYEFLTNDLFILREDHQIASRIACLHYEYYNDLEQLSIELDGSESQIQCVSTNLPLRLKNDHLLVGIGETQSPSLFQYADNKDVPLFLKSLQQNQ